MVNLIVDKILLSLATLPFKDRMVGIVKPASIQDSKGAVKTIPVAFNTDPDTCSQSTLIDLVPDSKKTSIIYFEDRGTTVREYSGEAVYMTANFNLVCWFNYKKIVYNYINTSLIALNIIKLLPTKMGNIFPLMGVFLTVTGEEPNDGSIFSKYSYIEAESQYITYPYGYVALNLSADFAVRPECIQDITVDPATCFTTKPPLTFDSDQITFDSDKITFDQTVL